MPHYTLMEKLYWIVSGFKKKEKNKYSKIVDTFFFSFIHMIHPYSYIKGLMH